MLTSPKKTDFCSSPILDNIVISTYLGINQALLSIKQFTAERELNFARKALIHEQ